MKREVDAGRKRIGAARRAATAVALALPLFLAADPVHAAGDAGPAGPSTAVAFEDVPGTDLKRVILTEKAAERLGIATGEVGEATIERTQIVGGQVVLPVADDAASKLAGGLFGGFGAGAAVEVQPAVAAALPAAAEEAWIRVTLSPGELQRLDMDAPGRILPLATRGGPGARMAMPADMPPIEDLKRSMLTLFYVVDGADHGLTLNERVRVELKLSGDDTPHLVVPYSAVYYDGQGVAWVYTNPEPLVFERAPIDVERIHGDLAVLNDGPPLGTTVVTVGAALLYGAEVIYKR